MTIMTVKRASSSALLMVAVLSCTFTGAGLAAMELMSPADLRKSAEREVFVVLDPRYSPPSARRIAERDSRDPGVGQALQTLGAIESVSVWYPYQFVSDEVLLEERARDPLSPLSVLNEVLVVRYRDELDTQANFARLAANPRVLGVQRNSIVRLSVADYRSASGAPSGPGIEGKYQWGMQLLDFPAARQKLRGNAYISVLDTGIESPGGSVPTELAPAARLHFSNRHAQTETGDVSVTNGVDEATFFPTYRGHGTHVSGIIAAKDDAAGVSGGCPGCALLVQSIQTTASVASSALLTSVARGTQLVNMSFGIPGQLGTVYDRDDTFCAQAANAAVPPCNALILARNREVVLVAASGNDRYKVQFPANQDGVMAVGGLEYVAPGTLGALWATPHSPLGQDPGPSEFPDCLITANRNPTLSSEGGSNCGPTQFLVAPARNVLSTFYAGGVYRPFSRCMDKADGANPAYRNPESGVDVPVELGHANPEYIQSGYGTCTGTSMAAPHVTAAAALVRSANPLLQIADVRRILQKHASGNDARLDDRLAYGYPRVFNSVTAALSGASFASPNAFDLAIKNRLTPLFSLYSASGRNHFYTIAPQMAVAAINGTLSPSPAYRLNRTSAIVTCSSGCSAQPISVSPPFTVLNPNGTTAAGVPVYLARDSSYNNQWTFQNNSDVSSSDASGVVPTSDLRWSGFAAGTRTAKVDATLQSDFPLSYARVGNTISGYPFFPSITTIGSSPRSTLSVYVSHVNPLASGPDMVPLYRLSGRCGQVASQACDNAQAPSYNPLHVTHRYTTDVVERDSMVSSGGYKFDGIEGYLFAKSYSNAPVSGAVRVCRLLDPVSDEMILFPATGSDGKSCNPPFPGYASSSYYTNQIGGTDWLGWAIPNYSGNTPPSISFTSPAGGSSFALGSSITLSASASDSSGIANVKFYANGALVATDSTSPYSRTWTPSAIGAYTIHAVATDANSVPWAATSNPRQITVTGAVTPPTLANPGFESPEVGSGYLFSPPTSGWTFTPSGPGGGSGVSGNGSAFTFQNANAPGPFQVGFIQGATSISQQVNFPTTGTFRVRFQAVQRVSNYSHLKIQVRVNGLDVGTPIQPGASYQTHTSSTFSISSTSTSHTITLLGVNDGFDNTVFLDEVAVIVQ